MNFWGVEKPKSTQFRVPLRSFSWPQAGIIFFQNIARHFCDWFTRLKDTTRDKDNFNKTSAETSNCSVRYIDLQ